MIISFLEGHEPLDRKTHCMFKIMKQIEAHNHETSEPKEQKEDLKHLQGEQQKTTHHHPRIKDFR